MRAPQRKLDRAVREQLGLSWEAARSAIRSGKIFVADQVATDPEALVASGVALRLVPNAPRPHVRRREALERDAIVHLDAQVVVVVKPSGLSTVPFGDETPDQARLTFDALVREILARKLEQLKLPRGRAPLGVVHRLDKETSGVMVFARTLLAKKHLAQQFREHAPDRRYFALVHGVINEPKTFRSYLIEDRGDGLRGSARGNKREGQLAITHVKPIERLRGATLVACELETGRTHQIRIHLAEAGHPLVGEKVYIRRYTGERIAAPRTMLHAAELAFDHPESEERLSFSVAPPKDFQDLAASLRLSPRSAGPGK